MFFSSEIEGNLEVRKLLVGAYVVSVLIVSVPDVKVTVVFVILAAEVYVTLVLCFHEFESLLCSVLVKDMLPFLFTRTLSFASLIGEIKE